MIVVGGGGGSRWSFPCASLRVCLSSPWSRTKEVVGRVEGRALNQTPDLACPMSSSPPQGGRAEGLEPTDSWLEAGTASVTQIGGLGQMQLLLLPPSHPPMTG